jgi:hypothetical protein
MTRSPVAASIEALESRIAPAALYVGNPDKLDTTYSKLPFVDIAATLSSDAISAAVGSPDPLQKGYYLKLNKGDSLYLYSESGSKPFVTSANAKSRGLAAPLIAFFVDKNADGVVNANELTGLSLSNGASVQVGGSGVYGDVVANFDAKTGKLGGLGGATSLLENKIALFSAPAVTGSIISGGVMSSINVGSVAKILTGAAANGVTYDFNGVVADGGDSLVVVPAAGKRGVDIKTVVVSRVDQILAGGGGAGAVGGSISDVTIQGDTDGFLIQAGAGGAGTGSGKGGAGGAVSKVVIEGLKGGASDASLNSDTKILGGTGGTSAAGTGGAGGAVTTISYGYEKSGSLTLRSATPLADKVLVKGGDGGLGRSGGAGGAVTDAKVFAAPTLVGNDIVVQAGKGGDSVLSGGAAGAGGALSKITAQNPGASTEAKASAIKVIAGDSGAATVDGASGANGGAISTVDLVGFKLEVRAGIGGTGLRAGSGGSISNVGITADFRDVYAESVTVSAGIGGLAKGASGGKGGFVDGLRVAGADLTSFVLNSGAGGDGQKGTGGAGGDVRNLAISDVEGVSAASSVTMVITAGKGGDGGTVAVAGNGGKGGSITGSGTINGNQIDMYGGGLLMVAGAGGVAKSSGSGGAGGSISKVSFQETSGTSTFGATMTAGAGGLGLARGNGGVGGSVSTLNLQVPGAVDVKAGAGGSGGSGGTAGAGGALGGGKAGNLFLKSSASSVSALAGDAGAVGAKGAAGGSVSNAVIYTSSSITVDAGEGRLGGAGGAISGIGFYGTSNLSAPNTFVKLTAGDGSGAGKVAGAGGRVQDVTGLIGQATTLIKAGQGGTSGSVAGAGGSVVAVKIKGGGGPTAVLRIEAGDALAATTAKVGGKGGDVSDVNVAPLFSRSTFLHVVAGDGGDAGAVKAKGGAGGKVSSVVTQDDIGRRTGAAFGFGLGLDNGKMGGVFAGKGGAGLGGGTAGLSGNVERVEASAIASIVAGKLTTGSVIDERNLAGKVTGIKLTGSQDTQTNKTGLNTGGFKNFTAKTTKVLGGLFTSDPTAANANVFKFTDSGAAGFGVGDVISATTDGFVAALDYDQKNMNVRAEAVLKRDADKVIRFTDLNNSNGQL